MYKKLSVFLGLILLTINIIGCSQALSKEELELKCKTIAESKLNEFSNSSFENIIYEPKVEVDKIYHLQREILVIHFPDVDKEMIKSVIIQVYQKGNIEPVYKTQKDFYFK